MQNKKDKGFTLVELLIVIVILGILATVTVFAVRGITDRGQKNACDVEKKNVDTAIEMFYAENQTDAGEMNDLVPEYLKTAPSTDMLSVTFTADGSAAPVVALAGSCL